MQQQRLAQEIQDAAVAGLIQKRPKMKASRSLPAVVLKPTPKSRVSNTRAHTKYAAFVIIYYFWVIVLFPFYSSLLCLTT